MIKISFPNNKKFKDLLIIFKEKAIQTIGNDNAINVEQAFQNFISEYNSKKTRKKRNKIKSLINNIKSNKDIFENLFLISDCS